MRRQGSNAVSISSRRSLVLLEYRSRPLPNCMPIAIRDPNARASKASPLLLLACASGQHIKSAVLTARRAGGGKGQFEFLTISLADVLITSFEVNATADNGPFDEVSLAFAQIVVDYREQNP